MRRKEFLITEEKALAEILNQTEWGTLALTEKNGTPYQVPVNHVWFNSSLYFHSAINGKKIKLLKNNEKAHFNAVLPLSIIPSYYTDPEMACNGTQFFLSVSMAGNARFETDPVQKGKVLSALMQKLQAEGGYGAIDPENERYRKELKATALVEIKPQEMAGKFKLGQNLTMETKKHIVNELHKRGKEIDLLTIQWINKYMGEI